MSARRAPAAAMSPQAGSGPVFCGMAVPLVADELQPARGGHAWMRRYPRSAEEGGLWRVTRRPEPIRPSTTEADDAMWCVASPAHCEQPATPAHGERLSHRAGCG